jgi:hypothetical protein
MMLARTYDDVERFNRAARHLLAGIAGSPSARERQTAT